MRSRSPMITYMYKVLDDHSLPISGSSAVIIEACWLVDMIHSTEDNYARNGRS
jgi:hypothetical protein